jgi:NAD(P)-dependent dehydrogenase (short-subunit alcohol dehydrogenase family)
MKPKPDYGEETYRGSGGLEGKKAVITGGDSGIGRAVALVFARERAEVLISYLEGVDSAPIAGAGGGHGVCKTTEPPSGV